MILRLLLRLAIIPVLLISVTPLSAQFDTTATVAATESLSSSTTESLIALEAEIKKVLAEADGRKAVTPESVPVAESITLLNQALEQVRIRDHISTETLEHEKAVREAPVILKRIKDEIVRNDRGTTVPELPTTASAEILSQWLGGRKAELDELRQRAIEIAAEQERRVMRQAAIPKEMSEAKRNLTQAEIEAQSIVSADDPLLLRARQLLGAAKVQAIRGRHQALEKEQARYNAREEFLPLASQLINERISSYESLISSHTEQLNELRRREVAASAQEIKQVALKADKSHPLVRSVASENSSITEEMNLTGIVEEHEQILEKLQEVQSESARISRQDESLRSKFNAVGYSDALGLLLQKQRNELPNLRTHREALQVQEKKLSDANLKSLEIQDSVRALGDPADVARRLMAEVGIRNDNNTDVLEIRREITSLLQARKEYLVQSRDAYENYFQTLIELNSAEEELITTTSSYAAYIDERILWLPSAPRVSVKSFAIAGSTVAGLLSSAFLRAYGKSLIHQASAAPAAYFLGLLLLILIIFSRRHWKIGLSHILEQASKNRLAEFRPAVKALWYAALFVLPLPLVLILAGLPLSNLYNIPFEQASLAAGFVRGGVMLFLLLYVSTIIRRKGIAEVFFAWPESSLIRLRHALSLLAWVFIPTVILVRTAQVQGSDSYMEVSRFTLTVCLLIVAYVFARLLRPKHSILTGTAGYKPGTWLYNFRFVIFAAVVIGPAGLAIAAMLGYVYTVVEIGQRLSITFWLGVGAVLLNEIIFFWILVKRRRLAIEEARKRREVKSQQNEASADLPNASVEPSIDIAAISQQAGRLLHVFVLGVFVLGLWGVWAGVLPALRYLDTQPLWSITRQVSESADGAQGQTRDVLVPVTLADLLLIFLIVSVAVAAIRNIPGLLDITVFQKFSVQQGERYAFNTLIRYVIIIVGLVYVFYKLGLQWKQIQWLAAAVSVGLGFGLQEIFANFVSGLILLFERPVRVGDIVTVGEVTGRVSQIRIRATTIINWDHKEHLIPNKELITGQVLNWTLSDRMVRLLITLNVAHGSDYNLARELLLKIAKEAPHVLDDPAPAAAIEKFGVSSVEFFLAVHLPSLDNMTDVRHDMLTRIENEFKEAGIHIPVPQMQVTIDERPAKKL